MENIIGFLILAGTLIISAIFAAQKKSGQNNEAEQSFQNSSDNSTDNDYDAGLTNRIRANPFENFMDYEEADDDDEPAKKEEKVTDKSQQEKITDSNTRAKKSSSLQQRSREKGKKAVNQPGLQRIVKKFDLKEAIIYSEIINRKHF